MDRIKDSSNAVVGSFDFEVFSAGRKGRACCSRFKLRCDAVGLHEKEILLLSVIGSETAVKALSAGLRSSGKDQKRILYSVHVGNVNQNDLSKCPDGYRIYRTKMDYGLWHLLCLARRDGFLPVVSDETIWQLLQSSRFTTPLLREWVPWLCQEMKRQKVVVELTQSGCHAGLMLADNECLDATVSKGINKKHLLIGGAEVAAGKNGVLRKKIKNLDGYLRTYGPLLGKQAERSLSPLHVPGCNALPNLDLIRTPFEAQSHFIEAARKALSRQKSLLLVGEMGTGKTLMGLSAIHAHAAGRAYRALVFCPGQLVNKWEREIRETIPGAEFLQIESWKTLLHFDRSKKPSGIEWYIIARDRAKLGAKWRPACQRRSHVVDGFIHCPQCGRRLVDDKREPILVGRPGKNGQLGTGLWQKRSRCEWVLSDHHDSQGEDGETADRLAKGCGSPLWQMTGELRRYEPALFIKRRLKYFFKYLILDELHEEKGADTAQGHAAAALAASCRKVIALTGTLIGGYAEHLRPLLFRLSPGSLVQRLATAGCMALRVQFVGDGLERCALVPEFLHHRSKIGVCLACGLRNRFGRNRSATGQTIKPGLLSAFPVARAGRS